MTEMPRRALLRAALAALATCAISACAFQPLHRKGGAVAELRKSVLLTGVEGREGYAFRRILERRLGAPGDDPAFILEARLTFERRGLAITRDDSVTRFDVIGIAQFTLRDAEGGKVRAEGVARALSAYSALATPYATRVAAQDADRRVAEDLAERVYAQIAAALSREEDAA